MERETKKGYLQTHCSGQLEKDPIHNNNAEKYSSGVRNLDEMTVLLSVVYVCMYSHAYNKSLDQPGKVANPARGQLNRENEYSPLRVRA